MKYSNTFEKQSNEPMRIKLSKAGCNLNSKTEWHSQEVERLRLTQVGESRVGQNTERQTINNIEIIKVQNQANTVNIEGKRKAGRPRGSQNRKIPK